MQLKVDVIVSLDIGGTINISLTFSFALVRQLSNCVDTAIGTVSVHSRRVVTCKLTTSEHVNYIDHLFFNIFLCHHGNWHNVCRSAIEFSDVLFLTTNCARGSEKNSPIYMGQERDMHLYSL